MGHTEKMTDSNLGSAGRKRIVIESSEGQRIDGQYRRFLSCYKFTAFWFALRKNSIMKGESGGDLEIKYYWYGSLI